MCAGTACFRHKCSHMCAWHHAAGSVVLSFLSSLLSSSYVVACKGNGSSGVEREVVERGVRGRMDTSSSSSSAAASLASSSE